MMRRHHLFLASAAFLALTAAAPATAQYIHVDAGPLHIRFADSTPPPVYREYRTRRPGRGYVWVAGYHDWRSHGWVWVPGHWARPVARDVYWVAPRYVRSGRYWRYEPAHWSNQRLVYVREHDRRHHDRGDRWDRWDRGDRDRGRWDDDDWRRDRGRRRGHDRDR